MLSENKKTPYRIGALPTERLVQTFKALGHRHRLRIIDLLCGREHNVGEIAEVLTLAPAIVSQQLRILRLNGLVMRRSQGGRALYQIKVSCLKELLRNLTESLEEEEISWL